MENIFNDMEIYCVGKQHFEPTYQDGPKIDLNEGGYVILLQYCSPTEEEIREIGGGKAEFRAVEVDGVLVFLAKFGDLPWTDMSLHRGLSHAAMPPRPEPGMGAFLHVMLVDSTTGVLVCQKAIGLMNRFSHALADMIESQSMDVPANWAAMVQRVYQKYTSDQLADMATVRN